MVKRSSLAMVVLLACIWIPAMQAHAAKLDLATGWNLLSSRVEIDANAVFGSNTNIESVWKWENGSWAVLLPTSTDKGASYASSKGFSFLSTIQPGDGFWVRSKESQSISLTGTEVDDTQIKLAKDWNLKGLRSSTPINVKDLFSDTKKYASVWKWVSNAWAVYVPTHADGGAAYAKQKGFYELKTINPGEGFWVNATEATDVVATPPVVGGTVTYPKTESSLQKIGLYLKGLLEEIPEVEMPPVPGATVKVYAATDTSYTNPLAETTTDANGNYSFATKDFDNPNTPDVELPPQVPLMVRAEFKSPIDPTKKVAVQAIVDPTEDPTKKTKLEVNPLTTAIAQKVKEFVENTFQVQLTKEIMDAAKTFIDLIATEVQKKGLTFFDEDDLVVGEYKDATSTEEKPDFQPPPNQNIADKVIDKGTSGLFMNMESQLMEKANAGQFTQTNVNVTQEKKIEHLIKYLASIGIKVQAGKTGEDSQKVIAFIAAPPHIPEDKIPGVMVFNDRAFRKIKPDTDLTSDKINAISDEGFRFYLKGALEGPVVSYEAVEECLKKVEQGLTTDLTKLAAVIKEKFIWQTETVQMVNGVPVFGKDVTPTTGADVNASELISQLTGKLAATPEEIAKEIAISPYYLVKFMEPLINKKMQEIQANQAIQNKQEAMNQFLKSLKDLETIKNEVMKTEFFQRAVDEISHAIFSAFEPELYGKVLSASTELKVKSALVLLKQMIDRPYLIDATKGWFTKNQEGEITWLSPNFSNFKYLSVKEEGEPEFTNQIFSAVLGVAIQPNTNFGPLVLSYWTAVDGLPEPDAFKLSDNALQQVMGVTKANSVTVKGILKDSDGSLMANKSLQLRKYDQNGMTVAQTVNTDTEGKFTFTNVQSGFPYDVYNNEKKVHYPFFADGYVDPIDLGEWVMPGTIPTGGEGAGPMVVPGVTLFVDDVFFNPTNPNDPQNGKPVGVRFANFASGQPFITTDADLFWTKEGLKAAENAGIAAIPEQIKGVLNLGQQKPAFTQGELAGTAQIQIKDLKFTLQWQTIIPKPKENNAVYVVKDKTGKYFLIEVRFWDKDAEGNPLGIIDMGFIAISSSGQVQVPQESFVVGPGGGEAPQFMPFMLSVGDYLDLNSKAQSPPADAVMGADPAVIAAADLRWLGNFYETYWKDQNDWQQKFQALQNSDRALAPVNGATMKQLTIQGNAIQLTQVTELKPAVQGQLALVTSNQEGKEFVIVIMKVSNGEINLMAVPKEQVLTAANQLLEGIKDNDQDGIPGVLDPNDFDPNVPGKGEIPAQPGPTAFTIPDDPDGDGLPSFLMDPEPNDPDKPIEGGNQDTDKDGLPKGFEVHFGYDDNDPNKPGFMGPPITAQGEVKLAISAGNPQNAFNNSQTTKLLGPGVGTLLVQPQQDGTKKVSLICLIRDKLLMEMTQWTQPDGEYYIVILDQTNKVVGFLMDFHIIKGSGLMPQWKLEQFNPDTSAWDTVPETVIPYLVFDGYNPPQG